MMALRAREATAFVRVYYWNKKGTYTMRRVLKGSADEAYYSGADLREKKTKGSGKN